MAASAPAVAVPSFDVTTLAPSINSGSWRASAAGSAPLDQHGVTATADGLHALERSAVN
jgi:hypothetical protein